MCVGTLPPLSLHCLESVPWRGYIYDPDFTEGFLGRHRSQHRTPHVCDAGGQRQRERRLWGEVGGQGDLRPFSPRDVCTCEGVRSSSLVAQQCHGTHYKEFVLADLSVSV